MGSQLAFVREFEGEKILVLANLSALHPAVELDLSRWAGFTPVEMFSQEIGFPRLQGPALLFSLSAHTAHHWLSLDARN